MAFELRAGQGTLHKNDKKGNEKAPDYRGELNINGNVLRIAGWLKDGRNGRWMSLKVDDKDDERRAATPSRRVDADGPADDIPF